MSTIFLSFYCFFALYLAWLRAITLEYIDEDTLEPPVPPGLRKLSKPLHNFVELFDVDEYLLQVAVESSADREVISDDMINQAIAKLPHEECNEFLLRLAQGEPHLSIELNRRLQKLIGISQPQSQQQRTIRQLLETAEQEREREEKRLAEEAEAKRIQELETLAKQEDKIWQDVNALIEKKQTKAYDEAVQILLKLQELAVYKEQESVFQDRLNQIYEQYRRRPGLLSRLRDADLQQG